MIECFFDPTYYTCFCYDAGFSTSGTIYTWVVPVGGTHTQVVPVGGTHNTHCAFKASLRLLLSLSEA